MKRPTPSGKEITFSEDELFFSRTDRRGVIIYGNDVFVRISGYERDELIGKPHSIIRHPDMPRCVFKLLWDTIEAGEPIAAYVKNLNAKGHAYWVLAVVFPVGNEYLSIRLKPTTLLLAAVKDLYAKTLAEEQVGGMEASAAVLMNGLKEAGFSNYGRFMTVALTSEIEARDTNMQASKTALDEGDDGVASAQDVLSAIRAISREGLVKFRDLFTQMHEFEKVSVSFQERTHSLIASFKRIQVVSLNVTVFARQFGESAIALGVISKEFHRLALDIEKSTEELAPIVNSIIQRSSLEIASLKLQMDMIAFFVQESIAKTVHDEGGTSVFKSLEDNAEPFTAIGKSSAAAAMKKVESLRHDLSCFNNANETIDRVLKSLTIITQMATLESSRVAEHQQAFASYLEQMEQFNSNLKLTTTEIKSFTRRLGEIQEYIQKCLPEVSGSMMKVLELAFSIKREH